MQGRFLELQRSGQCKTNGETSMLWSSSGVPPAKRLVATNRKTHFHTTFNQDQDLTVPIDCCLRRINQGAHVMLRQSLLYSLRHS